MVGAAIQQRAPQEGLIDKVGFSRDPNGGEDRHDMWASNRSTFHAEGLASGKALLREQTSCVHISGGAWRPVWLAQCVRGGKG